ncbi:thioredoxin-like protein [Nemania serpens]|nr:thioredoxin-like protein [Nemania serpens]
MSGTVNISSSGEWQRILSSSTIVITDFYADWCGPCKMIAPTFESLSTKFSKPGKITFCKVNVDNHQSIAQSHGVSAMPTFLIFKSGSIVETIRGANPPALTAAVEKAVKLAGTAAPGASFAIPGRTLGGSGSNGSNSSSSTPARRGGNNTLGGRSWTRFTPFNVINTLLTFFGLYLVSLFSVCPHPVLSTPRPAWVSHPVLIRFCCSSTLTKLPSVPISISTNQGHRQHPSIAEGHVKREAQVLQVGPLVVSGH